MNRRLEEEGDAFTPPLRSVDSPPQRAVNASPGLQPKYVPYILSNFQFVIKPPLHPHDHHYSSMCSHPDVMVAWKSVVAVTCHLSPESTSCPICLDSFVAPCVTPCGHAYCSVCIRQYLRKCGEKVGHVPTCPLCSYQGLTMASLVPAHIVTNTEPQVQATTSFTLVKRNKGGVQLYTTDNFTAHGSMIPMEGTPESRYTRYCIVDPPLTIAFLRSEQEAICNRLLETDNGSNE
eukprot:PhM_4_TR8446/c0_g1_i2/m.51362